MKPWLTVVGMGEDGLDGLSPSARALVEAAEVLVGGERHLSKVAESRAERLDWGNGFAETVEEIAKLRGRRVTVLASGDPMDFGAGTVLARRFGAAEVTVLPVPGAFSLACARLGWSRPDVACVTVHGRAPEIVALHLAPGAQILVLSENGETPAQLAALLGDKGYGPSNLRVLENMGGPDEGLIEGTAEGWNHGPTSDLNTVAIECRTGPGAQVLSRVPGLPEDVFEHDGQITKREVRAVTLAALAPMPGQVLWDVGAGSGAIAIEWLRAEPSAKAVAVEREPERVARIARNAANLGVPRLHVVGGAAPAVFDGLEPRPEAVFAGGGVGEPGLLEACWAALPAGGRLVANGVTLEAESRLFAFRSEAGGDVTRISVARTEALGERTGLKPLMPVTQYLGVKP